MNPPTAAEAREALEKIETWPSGIAARADIATLCAFIASAEQVGADAEKQPLQPAIGDYVLATKWDDGDPGDPWALGYYTGEDRGRHFVKDAAGQSIRASGYRRVGRITAEIGNWLWSQRDELERAPSKINLWAMYDWSFVNEKIADAARAQPAQGKEKT